MCWLRAELTKQVVSLTKKKVKGFKDKKDNEKVEAGFDLTVARMHPFLLPKGFSTKFIQPLNMITTTLYISPDENKTLYWD